MPETPDFNQIARQYFIDYRGDPIGPLAEQLRLIWNARGAADIAKIDAEWREGLAAAAIDRALRTLDR
jgi:hypothetical protein